MRGGPAELRLVLWRAQNVRPEAGTYDERFFDAQIAGSLRSARIILDLLFRLYQPRSVIDVGCGRGAWLAVAGALGAQTLIGVDGDWVDPARLLSDRIEFRTVDMEQDFDVGARYDLALSVEVAEHLSEDRAKPFVDILCRTSDVVLFGAAIPHQGGTNHINEQFQSYWVQIFESQDYECFDVIRPAVWNDDDVEWWYRQNTFLFVKRQARIELDGELLRSMAKPIVDIVHPLNYEALSRARVR
jgi:SAM-dependent methyltransferase